MDYNNARRKDLTRWEDIGKEADRDWFRSSETLFYFGKLLNDPDGGAAAKYYW